MGRIQGEHHVRSHRLLGTRRRYPDRRGNARRRRSVDRHLEVLESQYGLRCPTPLAAPALRRASRLALRAPSAPALRTCLLARLPSPSGLVSAATTCPRPAEVVGRGTWYREATALVAGFSPARRRRPFRQDPYSSERGKGAATSALRNGYALSTISFASWLGSRGRFRPLESRVIGLVPATQSAYGVGGEPIMDATVKRTALEPSMCPGASMKR